MMFYAAYDTGFKSGGINREFQLCGRGGQCLSPDQAFWEPETTTNYEIGLKSEWLDNRLRMNVALFFQVYEDYQVTRSMPGGANVITSNAAEVESKGLEADWSWLLSENFTFSGNISFIRAEYETYDDAPCPLLTAPGCTNGSQSLTGERLDNAPELSYTLTGEYRSSLAGFSHLDWFTRLDATYKSDHNLHVLQSKQTEQDSYYLLNARVGIESSGAWRVTGWVRNLADEDYLVSGQLASDGLRLIPGVPRTYGLTVDWFF